jgi:hypothetical protein
MPDYTLSKIYKIIDNTNGNIYVGSTCEPTLAKRLSKHVHSYHRYLNKKYAFITSFDILKNNSFQIILLEEFPCENRMQLHRRERHYIDTLNCINKFHPTRTDAEYYQANKIRIHERCSQKNSCECGGKFTHGHKSTHLKSKKHLKYFQLFHQPLMIIQELGFDYEKIKNYFE